MTPTARSLAECRARGFIAQVVEKWVIQARRRIDLLGFGDIMALDGQPGSLLIQATSDNGGNVAARVTKIRTECRALASAWLGAGNRIQVWGWGKKGAKGKRKLWTLRVVVISLVEDSLISETREWGL